MTETQAASSDLKIHESDQSVGSNDPARRADPPKVESIYLTQLSMLPPATTPCVVCKVEFEVKRYRGRPQKFCSDDCRGAQFMRQKNDWHRRASLRRRQGKRELTSPCKSHSSESVATADAERLSLGTSVLGLEQTEIGPPRSNLCHGLSPMSFPRKSDQIDQCSFAAAQSFKFAVSDAGEISGYGAVFGNIDDGGDRVLVGAFSASLAKHAADNTKPLMLWQHRMTEPIGSWTSVYEDSYGLAMKGKLNLNTTRGKDAYEHIRAGDVGGLSIGYRTVKAKANGPVRDLHALDLWETSVVSRPMNRAARITGVKAESAVDIERILREGGLPRALAKSMAAAAWTSVERTPTNDLSPMIARIKAATIELRKKSR